MSRWFLVTGLLLSVVGCASSSSTPAKSSVDGTLFHPVAMRLHPVFTQVRDWNGDNKLDGIEALVEFQDAFGDPTKAAGHVVFELYQYVPFNPDPRGLRLIGPWDGSLNSVEDQRSRWSRTSRTYSFQLAYPNIRKDQSYVLSATFELSGGGRFFSRMIIEGQKSEPTVQKSSTSVTPVPTTQELPRVPANQPPARTDAP